MIVKQDKIIYADLESLKKLAKMFEEYPHSARIALEKTTRYTATQIRKELPRLITSQFGVSEDMVRRAINRRKVRAVKSDIGMNIGIAIFGPPMNMARFEHTPLLPPEKGNKYPISVLIYRKKGMVKLKAIKGADGKMKNPFIASTGAKSEDENVSMQKIIFIRTGRYKQKGGGAAFKTRSGKVLDFNTANSKEEIKPYGYSLSIPQMLMSDEVGIPLVRKLQEIVEPKLEKEIMKSLDELGKKLE